MEDQVDTIPDKAPKKQKSARPARRESWAPAVKWIFICLTMLLFTLIVYKAYRVITAPARGISEAAEMVKDQASNVSKRLDVSLKKPKSFSQLSEDAFEVLVDYPKQKPLGMTQKIYWAQHLRGSNQQVCTFKLDFGDGDIPVMTAANNKDYQTAKAVGSLQGRTIRVHLLTGEKEIGLRSYWNDDLKKWKMRWRRMTLGKPLNDEGAQNTLRKILAAIPDKCVSTPAGSPPSK